MQERAGDEQRFEPLDGGFQVVGRLGYPGNGEAAWSSSVGAASLATASVTI